MELNKSKDTMKLIRKEIVRKRKQNGKSRRRNEQEDESNKRSLASHETMHRTKVQQGVKVMQAIFTSVASMRPASDLVD